MRVHVRVLDPSTRLAIEQVGAESGYELLPLEGDPQGLAGAEIVFVDADEASWPPSTRWARGATSGVIVCGTPEAVSPFKARGFATLRLPAIPAEVKASIEAVGSATVNPNVVGPNDQPTVAGAAPTAGGPNLVQAVGASDPQLLALVRLLVANMRVPTAAVTLFDGDRQFYVAGVGLPEDLNRAGFTPRDWSFCRFVAESGAPLAIGDASLFPSLSSIPLAMLGVIRAYAGVPVRVSGVGMVGTVCVHSREPRPFSHEDLAALQLAAHGVEAYLERVLLERSLTPRSTRQGSDAATAAATTGYPSPKISEAEGDDLTGQTLADKYVVTASLGAGGMGRVFLARDRVLGQLVAIKLLSGDDRHADALIREARMMATIRHPNVAAVHGWGQLPRGGLFLVLEWVRGVTLHERLQDARQRGLWIEPSEACRILRNIAGALDTLHGAGLVHGDVKPANVMLDASLDRAVLIDFGLAMHLPSGWRSSSGNWNPSELPTAKGGTPGYSAPEQLEAGRPPLAHPSLDVYALGALAYAVLIGAGPFAQHPPSVRLERQRQGELTLPSAIRPELPGEIDNVIRRALSPNPTKRYRTPTELVDAIESAFAGLRSARRPTLSSTAQPLLTRGIIFQRMRAAVQRLRGTEGEEALVRSLDADSQATLRDATDPTELYPSDAFVAYLRAHAEGDVARAEQLGHAVGRTLLSDVLPSLQIERAPFTLLRAFGALSHRFHGWGTFEFEPRARGRATASMVLPKDYPPAVCGFFGGMMRALVNCATPDVHVEHESCAARGDPFCVLAVSWS